GYGYVEFQKNALAGRIDPQRVTSFREKPDARTAKRFIERGHFYWNAGMFFWRAATVLELMRHHQPKTATLLAGLPPFGTRRFKLKLAEVYPLCENISIDYAIAEKAGNVAGIAMDDIGWNDVGSWDAVYELADKDAHGNASRGELIAQESRGNFVDAAKTVALVGVENLVIVE